MADQCIVCLEELDVVPQVYEDPASVAGPSTTITAAQQPGHLDNPHPAQPTARIQPCKHILHDFCLREWAQKANSCPICRHAFNLVEVLSPQGTVLSEYAVEDKKQVADFDPNAWIEDNQEEEETNPCPICLQSDQEDVLLLCDGCDAPYHTHCVDLDGVPNGDWFCMECASDGAYARAREPMETARRGQSYSGRTQPRTQASVRRSRQRLRTDTWVGIWGLIGNRIHDASGVDLDLDNFSDDDQLMNNYRPAQRRTPEERREFHRWQQRLNIASRQGAREIFQRTAPIPREQRRQTPEMSPDESLAWGALEKAKDMDSPNATPKPRKRKSRSATGSPAEPGEPKEPERKLKRPRTRIARPPTITNAPSSSRQPLASPIPSASIRTQARPVIDTAGEPSFLSSLLREVETATSDDDSTRAFYGATAPHDPSRVTSPSLGYSSSPGASPSPSSSTYHTPRAMSTTPPPTNNMKRPGSPLPLTSRIEPNYSPSSPPVIFRENSPGPVLELRQPTPRRNAPIPRARSLETSPARASMSIEAKEGINKIVKSALAPHWKSGEITKEQYAEINRGVSRKLYDWVAVADGNREVDNDENIKWGWEKIAAQEVATAIKSLSA